MFSKEHPYSIIKVFQTGGSLSRDEQAVEWRQSASDVHNKKETPNFAKSIEGRALGKSWHTF